MATGGATGGTGGSSETVTWSHRVIAENNLGNSWPEDPDGYVRFVLDTECTVDITSPNLPKEYTGEFVWSPAANGFQVACLAGSRQVTTRGAAKFRIGPGEGSIDGPPQSTNAGKVSSVHLIVHETNWWTDENDNVWLKRDFTWEYRASY